MGLQGALRPSGSRRSETRMSLIAASDGVDSADVDVDVDELPIGGSDASKDGQLAHAP